jgi:aspartate-semialdehyde dehydrogenase
MNRNPHVAVVGATGAVGVEMIATLEKRRFPLSQLTLLASLVPLVKRLKYKGQDIAVKELTRTPSKESISPCSAPAATSRASLARSRRRRVVW